MTPQTKAKLKPLFEYLDGLTTRATIEELQDRLAALDVTVGDFSHHVRFHDHRYLRNLFRKGPLYHALILCWRSGQRSPIHNHAESTCGVRVLQGVCTETKFEATPSGLLKAVSSSDMLQGEIGASQDADVHQISNLQSPGEDLITLHVYSPPLLKMETYSLTDATVGEYWPEVLEHMGSGI